MDKNTIEWNQAQERAKEISQEKKEEKLEFERTLDQAKEDVIDFINNADHYSYNDIENIMHGYGLEMDYIEDFLL